MHEVPSERAVPSADLPVAARAARRATLRQQGGQLYLPSPLPQCDRFRPPAAAGSGSAGGRAPIGTPRGRAGRCVCEHGSDVGGRALHHPRENRRARPTGVAGLAHAPARPRRNATARPRRETPRRSRAQTNVRRTDAVALVHHHDLRLVLARRLLVEPRERADDDEVAGRDLASGGAVHAHDAGAGGAFEGVGLEALAVVHVPDVHGLELDQVHRFHERLVDRDRALVVEVRLGHGRAVDLAAQELPHGGGSVLPDGDRLGHGGPHRASALAGAGKSFAIARGAVSAGSRQALSMSRTPSTQTATASCAGASTRATGSSVARSHTTAYSSRARGSSPTRRASAPAIASLVRAPSATARRAASSAAGTMRAARRPSADRRAFRLDIASPSASRTIGAPTTSTAKSRSRAMRRTTASCW